MSPTTRPSGRLCFRVPLQCGGPCWTIPARKLLGVGHLVDRTGGCGGRRSRRRDKERERRKHNCEHHGSGTEDGDALPPRVASYMEGSALSCRGLDGQM